MRVITANVNGIRATQRRGGLEWLAAQDADVIALQEVRATPKQLTTAFAGSPLEHHTIAHVESASAGRGGSPSSRGTRCPSRSVSSRGSTRWGVGSRPT